jgi:hypothetical protein
MDNQIFLVLGASDLEMNEVEEVLKSAAERGQITGYGYAVADGKRVHPGNAYKATSFSPVPATSTEIIEIECEVDRQGYEENHAFGKRIDHHRPGDFGFGRPAKDALIASSLGQLLKLLGLEPTQKQLVIAAADHNLAVAYQGDVPNVAPTEVFDIRLPELMARNRATEADVRNGIREALQLLKKASRVKIGNSEVADVRGQVLPYALEAATIAGIEFIGRVDTRDEKKVFLSGKPETIAAFLASPPDGISGTYGDPARGFAGGMLR